MADPVKITFLGGLGEIGRNCFCIEVEGRILVVDCGIMFPEPDMPGVDLVLPDFTYLRERADAVEGVVLTHAHEDHAGGLAFLLRDISFPIYGSPLSLGLARSRIEEAGLLDRTAADPGPGRRAPRRSARSTSSSSRSRTRCPHAFAAAYHTPQGTILHSGDFKIDLTPVDGRRTDLASLGEIAPPARGGVADAALGQHERRAARLHAVGVDRRRRDAHAVPRPRGQAASSSRASRRTCTGCSRSPRPRSAPAGASRSSAAR